MRDKLAELIGEVLLWEDGTIYDLCKKAADRLIANGVTFSSSGIDCPECNGNGWITVMNGDKNDYCGVDNIPCQRCNGTGKIAPLKIEVFATTCIDPVDRNYLLKEIHNAGGTGALPDTWANGWDKGIDEAYDIVSKAPTIESEPIKHGRWIGTSDGYADGEPVYDVWECSECGYDADGADEKPSWKRCPECGAIMDGDIT